MRSSMRAARRWSSTTSGWSSASPSTLAITRRGPVMRRPRSRQARSMASAVLRLHCLSTAATRRRFLGPLAPDIRTRSRAVHFAPREPIPLTWNQLPVCFAAFSAANRRLLRRKTPLERQAHGESRRRGAVRLGVVGGTAAHLLKTQAAVKAQGRLVSLLDLEVDPPDAAQAQLAEMVGQK